MQATAERTDAWQSDTVDASSAADRLRRWAPHYLRSASPTDESGGLSMNDSAYRTAKQARYFPAAHFVPLTKLVKKTSS